MYMPLAWSKTDFFRILFRNSVKLSDRMYIRSCMRQQALRSFLYLKCLKEPRTYSTVLNEGKNCEESVTEKSLF